MSETLTPEQQEELERKAAEAQELEDLRRQELELLRERVRQMTVPQAPAQQHQQNNTLTPEQLAALNEQARENPVAVMAQIAALAANQSRAQFADEAGPVITTTADMYIGQFKSHKASDDPLYKQILPEFDKQLADVNRRGLLNLSDTDRSRILSLRWDAAAANVYRKAAEKAQKNQPPNTGGGGAGGGSNPPAKKTVFEKADPQISALALRLKAQGLLSDEDLASIDTEIDAENE
jgi:hypothetical protein